MTGYINELILTVVICRIVSMIAPEGEKRRYIMAVGALVTLLALISPIRYIVLSAEELISSAAEFFSPDEEVKETDDAFSSAAGVIFRCARDEFGFDTTGGEITFYTDEEGNADEIMIFFDSGSLESAEKLRQSLEDELSVTVHVYLGEVDEYGG